MRILGLESSCDETAAAVVEDGRTLLSSVVASQVEIHKLYGGVVPEIASRAHTEAVCGVTRSALEKAGLTLADIDAVAVTVEPGLIGALLTGLSFAKGLACAAGKPLVPVHHIRGHIAANYLVHPLLALVVSGGDTSLIRVDGYTDFKRIGQTRDDAAGEAFDKAARVLGLPYPGGLMMDRLATAGRKDAFPFTAATVHDSEYDFSFSGLKTAVINCVHTRAARPAVGRGNESGHRRLVHRRAGPHDRDPRLAAAGALGRSRARAGGRRGGEFPPARRADRAVRTSGPPALPASPLALRRQRGDDRRTGLLRIPRGQPCAPLAERLRDGRRLSGFPLFSIPPRIMTRHNSGRRMWISRWICGQLGAS